jgi:SAM-dependent methyltransferase
MRRFLRRSSIARDPLAVTMTGVRMGERALQIGVSDVRLAALIAAKPGLSGQATIVVADDRAAERARDAAATAGALVDIHIAPLDALPFAEHDFDVVILHAAAQQLAPLQQPARTRAMAECHRVLRAGGRLVAVEAGTRTGLARLMQRAPAADPEYDSAGGTAAVLAAAGFKAVRVLADREGYRFIEGLRR